MKFIERIKESLRDHNIMALEEKRARQGSLSWQDQQMLDNMIYGIGRTGR